MSNVLKLAFSLLAFLIIEQVGLCERSLIRNSRLAHGLKGWHVKSDEIEMYIVKEPLEICKQNPTGKKAILLVKMDESSESSLVAIRADQSVEAFANLHYFIKVGFANAAEARFVVDILDPDGQSIWQETYTVTDESLYHDLYPRHGVTVPKAGCYTLAIRAQSSADLEPCFFYYSQLGTSAAEIGIDFPKNFPPGFNELGDQAMTGQEYTVYSQSTREFLSIKHGESSVQLSSKQEDRFNYIFELMQIGDNQFKIRNVESKRCLEFEARTGSVKAVACAPKQRQNWVLEDSEGCCYYIRPQNSENCLEVFKGKLTILRPIDGCDQQKFRLAIQK